MHELGIVFYAIDAIEKVARENNAKKVVSATLELGEVSTVVPEYFMDLWNWEIKRRPLMKECQLNLVTLKAITFCEDCEKTYSTVEHARTCPYCGSKRTYLLSGKEINLRDIKVI